MQASPLRTHRKPGYPTRLEIKVDPELLRRHLPATWAAKPEVATAAAILLTLVLSGCDRTPTNAAKAVVAPVFDHGPGRGSIGCIAVAPPVFLSEEEAWQVIDDELAKAKVFVPDQMVLVEGTTVSQRVIEHEKRDGAWAIKVVERPETAIPFKADRGSPKLQLAIEFVSKDRYAEEGGPVSNSTGASYAFKVVAATLADQIAHTAKKPIRFGVFYDPLSSGSPTDPEIRVNLHGSPLAGTEPDQNSAYEQRRIRARAESKRLLRLQVRDFIHWLQAQGAI